jgi:hypothetical protein
MRGCVYAQPDDHASSQEGTVGHCGSDPSVLGHHGTYPHAEASTCPRTDEVHIVQLLLPWMSVSALLPLD